MRLAQWCGRRHRWAGPLAGSGRHPGPEPVGDGDDGDGGDDEAAVTTEATQADAGRGSGETATLAVVTRDVAFDPAELEAPAGSTVTVSLTNEGQLPHTFTIEELDVDESLSPGSSGEAELTMPEEGEVTYFCQVHGRAAMSGTLTAQS